MATLFSQNFNNFNGGGFAPGPGSGQLDSDVWRVLGLSEGDGTFGGTHDSGDFARGSSTGGETTGGVYAFDIGGDTALGVQPTGGDATPGQFDLMINNGTGGAITSLDVAFDVSVFNDEDRSSSIDLLVDPDNDGTFDATSGFVSTTPETGDPSPDWQTTSLADTIASVNIPSGNDFVLRFETDDAGGSGSRDEFAVDNIAVETGGGATTGVVINEVLADPAGGIAGDANGDGTRDSGDDEFVEIVNDTGASVDLTNWTLSEADPSAPEHTFGGITLAPGEALVVFGGGTVSGSFGGAQTTVASGLSLTNGGDTVTLADDGDSTVDEIAYGSAGGAPAADNDEALTRDPDFTGGFAGHGGADSADSSPFSPGTQLDGTPFSGNTDVTPPSPTGATVTGDGLTVTFDEALDGGSLPTTGDFTVTADGSAVTVASVDGITGGDLNLTLQSAVAAGASVGIDYSGSALQDAAGNAVATFSGQGVINATPPDVVINEILADPATGMAGDANGDGTRDSGDDEFVEIVNNASVAVDLSGWTLSDDDSVRHTFAGGLTLAPGEALVVFGGEANPGAVDTNGFGAAQVVIGSGLSLNNGDDRVVLQDGSGTIVDQLAYGEGGEPDGGDDQSLTRDPDLSGGFVKHGTAAGAAGAIFSPGTQLDGTNFSFDGTPPSVTGASVDGTTLTVTFDEALDGGSLPAPGDFTVGGSAGGSIAVERVDGISGGDLTLTLATPVPAGVRVTLDHTQGGTPLRDASANPVAGFTDQTVTTDTSSSAPIVINEILADPDGGTGDANGDGTVETGDDEFVELVNTSGAPLDIGGWTLREGAGPRHTFASDTVLNPGEVIVVFGGGTPTGFGSARAVTASEGALGLNNGGDTVTVNDGTADVASVTYGSEGGDDQALTRDADLDGTLARHESADTADSSSFSPGTQLDGNAFAVTDVTAPTLQSAGVAADTLTLSFGEALDAGSTPAANDFTVTGDGSGAFAVNGVTVTGSDVTLTLGSSVDNETVTLDYSPGGDPIQDAAGNASATLTGQSVTNNTDTTGPTLRAAIANGSEIRLVYDETLDAGSVPAITDYSITVDGSTASIDTVAVTGARVDLTLDSALGGGEAVEIAFTNAGDVLRDTAAARNPAGDIATRAIGNTTGADPVINELLRDQPGMDEDEFVEILGQPGQDLSGLRLLELEADGTADVGEIKRAVPLGGAGPAGFHTQSFDNKIGNGSVALLLVAGFTGSDGDDLDSDDDGVLDSTPWATLHDGIALADDTTPGQGLAETVLFPGFGANPFEVGSASRALDGRDRDSPADWVRNDFSGEGAVDGVSGTTDNTEAFNTPNAGNRDAIPDPAPADRPSLTVPGAQEVLTGASLQLTGIDVADPDGSALTLKLAVDAGTLSVPADATGGADALAITGNGSDTLHIAGTPAEIAATLDAGVVLDSSGSSNGDTITLAAAVGDGLEGGDSASVSVDVTDTPANQPPAITLPGGPVAVASTGGTPLGGLGLSDAAGPSGESFTVTLETARGALTATAANGATVSGGGTDTLTITDADAADIAATLGTVAFSGGGYVGASRITATATDGAGGFDQASVVVNATTGGGDSTIDIEAIQGSAHRSGVVGEAVQVTGEVTAERTVGGDDGFFLQTTTPDGDDRTSPAIFVATQSLGSIAPGNAVTVTGTVEEAVDGSTDLPRTQIALDSVDSNDGDTVLDVAATDIGDGGRAIPTDVIEDDGFASFDIDVEGLDFWESLESTLLSVDGAVAVTAEDENDRDIRVVADGGANATGFNTGRGVVVISGGPDDGTFADDDFNPERIKVSDAITANTGDIQPGDGLGALDGVLSADGAGFELLSTDPVTVDTPSSVQKEATSLTGDAQNLTLAGMNVENLDPGDTGKFPGLADLVADRMNNPDIIALQEVQDNTGSAADGTVSASQTAQDLIDAIAANGNGADDYAYFDFQPVAGQEGGEPGGNIRVGYLFRANRVDLALPDTAPSTGTTLVAPNGGATAGSSELTTRIPDTDASADTAFTDGDGQTVQNAFQSTRIPASARFTFEPTGASLEVVNVHFSSRGGSDPLRGSVQPPKTNEGKREAQAHVVRDHVETILADDANANVAVLGDYNTFGFSSTLDILENTGGSKNLHNLEEQLAPNERFSFEFAGNAQTLDHALISNNLHDHAAPMLDKVHANVGFDNAASDHDPLVTRLDMSGLPEPVATTTPPPPPLPPPPATPPRPPDDTVTGDAGADTLNGAAGQRLVGGLGADTFDLTGLDGEVFLVNPMPMDRIVFAATDLDRKDVAMATRVEDGVTSTVLRPDLDGEGTAADDPRVVLDGVSTASLAVRDRPAGGTALVLEGSPGTSVFLTGDTGLSLAAPAQVFGAAGSGRVFLERGAANVRLDASPSRLDIDRPASELRLAATDTGIEITDGDTVIARLPSLDGALDLRLADGGATLRAEAGADGFVLTTEEGARTTLDADGVAVAALDLVDAATARPLPGDDSTPAANAFLPPDATFTAAEPMRVFGMSGGNERVVVPEGAGGVQLDANMERVDLGYTLGDLSFALGDGGLDLAANGGMVLRIPSLNQDMVLRLADGDATLRQTGAERFELVGANGGIAGIADGADTPDDIATGDIATGDIALGERISGVGTVPETDDGTGMG